MLKLAGEFVEGQLADHMSQLDAHHYAPLLVVRTGEYTTFPLAAGHMTGNNSLVANTLYAAFLYIPRKITVDRLAVEVATAAAGKSIRLGIYHDGDNLYPGSLALDAGAVATDTTGIKTAVVDQQLLPGRYWAVVLSDGTPAVYGDNLHPNPLGIPATDFHSAAHRGWAVAQTYGALPAAFPTGGSFVTNLFIRCVALRVASLD